LKVMPEPPPPPPEAVFARMICLTVTSGQPR
jgi:hypothetical protein